MLRLPLSVFSWFGSFFHPRHDFQAATCWLASAIGRGQAQEPTPEMGTQDRLFWLGSVTVLGEVARGADRREIRDGRELASCRSTAPQCHLWHLGR